MIQGHYLLRLICSKCHRADNAGITHQTYAKAMQIMTKRGWKPTRDGEDVICPLCVKPK